ncbi:Tetratricopeptide repeat protein [Actinidia chinensis var. chinensis]|uniref:Tetratricopeptide repeat protein n=1 Tax=Actinidia chinensis var. chinensis TaxID=1590841 RepID=A0A2R6P720_ACTCC|nr:Tetratricopeptide repeat protein [Actinidia chinensis var. chinensis]
MALWMEKGSEPQTESEIADLVGINALKESAAIELKEKGNEYVKMGKKHYSDAIDCYTRAINQNVLSDSENSILFANRAHVNLLLGNYRRALMDAEDAIKLCPTNVKALYRAVKASLSLNLLSEAKQYCEKGLQQSPDNEELRKLARQVDLRKSECERHEAQISKAVESAKGIVSAIEDRNLKIGKASFQELIGLKKSILDKDNILHWPVLLLYAEFMTSDIIEDFCETDMFSAHLDMMFSESCHPLPWDKEKAYTREAVELYYEAGSGVCLSRKEIIRYLLEGTAGSHLESFGDDYANESFDHRTTAGGSSAKWVKVNEKRALYDVLKEPNFIIPGIPVFYIVSKRSSFYKDFKAGKWAPPGFHEE